MDLWPCSSNDLDHLTRQEVQFTYIFFGINNVLAVRNLLSNKLKTFDEDSQMVFISNMAHHSNTF